MKVQVRRMQSKKKETFFDVVGVKTASPYTPILKVREIEDGVEVVIKQNCIAVQEGSYVKIYLN